MYDEKWALERAVEAAKNSNCKSQRGVVIWDRESGNYSSGWNAPPKPLVCDGSDTCRLNCAKTAVHAEQQAIINFIHFSEIDVSKCEMIHVKIVNDKPVTSEKPSCWQCSKLILASGLKSMWLYQIEGFVEYSALEFHEKTLINCGLKPIEVKPSKEVILTRCDAARDGECINQNCPQLKDGEPEKTGRGCPLPWDDYV